MNSNMDALTAFCIKVFLKKMVSCRTQNEQQFEEDFLNTRRKVDLENDETASHVIVALGILNRRYSHVMLYRFCSFRTF